MKVSDKYTLDKTAEPEKIKISEDAIAICEALDRLTKEVSRLR